MPSTPATTAATEAAMADPVPRIQSIKSFTPVVNDAGVVADLRSRIASARARLFPSPESSAGAEAGPAAGGLPADLPAGQQRFAPDVMAGLLRRWEQLDLDGLQARLTRFEHFTAKIDWCHLHFIHRRSPRPDAIPLLLLHGWPGSIWEFALVIDALAEPDSEDEPAFHVVAPSLPGYLWSSGPPSAAHYVGDVHGYSRILNALMVGLGYGWEPEQEQASTSAGGGYAVQGGDWGSCHARVVACIPGSAVRAVHINFCPTLPPGLMGKVSLLALHALPPAWLLAGLKAIGAHDRIKTLGQVTSYRSTGVYYHIQGNRPNQLIWGLLDSPVALLGYIGPLITEWVENRPEEALGESKAGAGDQAPAQSQASGSGMTVETLLELVTLYWVTKCVGTSFLPYVVNKPFETILGDPALYIRQPLGYSVFPRELIIGPVPWVKATGNLIWAVQANHGGHHPHIEVPSTYLAHVRQAFSPSGTRVDTSLAGQPLVPLKGLWDEKNSHSP